MSRSSASRLFNAQVPVESMARVCAAGYDDLSPDSDDDSPRLTKDPRSAACGAEVSPLKPVMPRVLTTVSSMVKHPETSTWHVKSSAVRQGVLLPADGVTGHLLVVDWDWQVVLLDTLGASSPAQGLLSSARTHARNMLLSRGLFLVFVSGECIVIV